MARLQSAGKLLPESDVAKRVLSDTPTRKQIVTESERQEQRDRDRQASGAGGSASRLAEGLQTAGNLAKGLTGAGAAGEAGGLAGIAGTVGQLAGPVAIAFAATKAIDGVFDAVDEKIARIRAPESKEELQAGLENAIPNTLENAGGPVLGRMAASFARLEIQVLKMPWSLEKLGTSVLDASEKMREFSPSINTAFVRLEWLNRLQTAQNAQASAGSTTFLAEELGGLRKDLQPLEQTFTTALNTVAALGIRLARFEVMLIRMMPMIQVMEILGRAAEKFLGQSGAGQDSQMVEFLRTLGLGKWGGPMNNRPNPYGDEARKNRFNEKG
jgi:hypothetical protein